MEDFNWVEMMTTTTIIIIIIIIIIITLLLVDFFLSNFLEWKIQMYYKTRIIYKFRNFA
jgi:uncharacterized SAM-binding protein YcdF (DUF218 family)